MKRFSITWLLLIQWALAFEWIYSSIPKWTDSKFIDGIAKTLEGFATKTPHVGYGNFLTGVAIPNAELFGNLIRSGELAVGLGLAISGLFFLIAKRMPALVLWLTVIACFGGALMNLNFFLASGSASPSAWGLNLLMASMEIILGIFYLQNRNNLME
jgi:hypothetical protein